MVDWSVPEIRRGDTPVDLIAANVPFVANVRLRSESDRSAALPRIDAMCPKAGHLLATQPSLKSLPLISPRQ
jgi:hypothetical protein